MNKLKYVTLGLLLAALMVLIFSPSTLELEHREPESVVHQRILFNADKVIEEMIEEMVIDYNNAILDAVKRNNFEQAKSLSVAKYYNIGDLKRDQKELKRLEAKQAEQLAAKYIPIK